MNVEQLSIFLCDLFGNNTYFDSYGVVDVKNVGSTAATFAVKNACIQNNKFCN